MDHSVLTILDLGIIAAYLVIMVLVGVYSVRRIQNTKDYYVAGRSFGPMVLMATVCATIIGGSGLMGRMLQHETDHLDGHVYLDRLEKTERREALRYMREHAAK